jgi:hypothetical protein
MPTSRRQQAFLQLGKQGDIFFRVLEERAANIDFKFPP